MRLFALKALRILATVAAAGIALPATASTLTRTSAFTYDPTTGLLLSETVEPDTPQTCVTTAYTYDAYGNKLTSTTANCAGATGRAVFAQRQKAVAYAGQSVAVSQSTGTVTVVVPTGAFGSTLTAVNPAGTNLVETRATDPQTGLPLTVTDPNGLTATVQYDDYQRKVLEVAPDGNRVRTSYCYIGGTVSQHGNSAECSTLPAGAVPSGAVTYVHTVAQNSSGTQIGPYSRVYFDRLGRQMRSETQGFDGNATASRLVVVDVTYNLNGTEEFKSQPYFVDTNASVAAGSATSHGGALTEYDVLGRAVAVYVTDTGGGVAKAFPMLGTRQSAKTSSTYFGLQLTVTNDKNQSTVTTKDALGRRLKVQDALGATMAYLHDPFDNMVRTKDALGNVTQAAFDLRGRRTSLTDPSTGTTTFDYNALGELVYQQTANQALASTSTQMVYDALGRMTQRSMPEYTTNWSLDKYADSSACTMGLGKLCEVTTTHGVGRKVTYDSALGRPLTAVQSVTGGPTYTSSVTYDVVGRIAARTWPTGVQASYSYTALGYLEKVNNAATSAMLWQAKRINAWGKVEQEAVGNGVQTTRTFDATSGQVNQIQAGTGNAVLDLQLTWDSIGNLSTRADNNGAGAGVAVSDVFTYDAINRLSTYKVQSPALNNFQRLVYLQYNALGNLLYKTDVGVYTYPTSGSTRPHAVSSAAGTSYTYDVNGNMTAASAGKYSQVSYTSFNLPDSNIASGGLLGADGTRYAWKYGPDMERIQETRVSAGLTRTTWSLHPNKESGLSFEQEITGTTISNRHYITATSGVIGVLTTQGDHTTAGAQTIVSSMYWHRDHLGSIAATTDANGAAQHFAYDPFGKRRQISGAYDASGTIVIDYNTPGGTDRGFTGHEHLDDVGIVHMNGRLYDANIGRFMQSDPVVHPEIPASYNRYSYILNNPLNNIDPTGFDWLLDMVNGKGRGPMIYGVERDSLNTPCPNCQTTWNNYWSWKGIPVSGQQDNKDLVDTSNKQGSVTVGSLVKVDKPSTSSTTPSTVQPSSSGTTSPTGYFPIECFSCFAPPAQPAGGLGTGANPDNAPKLPSGDGLQFGVGFSGTLCCSVIDGPVADFGGQRLPTNGLSVNATLTLDVRTLRLGLSYSGYPLSGVGNYGGLGFSWGPGVDVVPTDGTGRFVTLEGAVGFGASRGLVLQGTETGGYALSKGLGTFGGGIGVYGAQGAGTQTTITTDFVKTMKITPVFSRPL